MDVQNSNRISRQTILLIDDIEINRAIFRKIFSDSYRILQAENGQEGLDLLYDNHVDLVVLDIEMPVLDGYEVIRTMKASRELAAIPIVVTTGAVDKSERQALALGADEFISQPYDPFIIQKRIDNLLQKHTLQCELYAQQQQMKAALDDARRANHAKTEFLSNMSHEIRTPLNAIIGMARLAQEETSGNPRATRYLGEINDSGRYLLGIINDVLDMNSIESGHFVITPVWCSPRDIMLPCVEMIAPLMAAKRIVFTYPHFSHEKLKYEVLFDVQKTQQLLMSLLNNACKFTRPGGRVALTLSSVANDRETMTATDEIVVTDTGCGMSEEFLKRAFEPFEQERDATTAAVKGTGLGLTIARSIAEMMGGELTAQSTLGSGSSFTVRLSYRYRLAQRGGSRPAVTAVTEHQLRGRRILLAEDHPMNATIVIRLLENQGASVLHAKDGVEAVEAFQNSKSGEIDAVVMDIRMPRMDGLEATRAIRALERADAKTVAIVALSANAFEEDERLSIEAGMNAHLTKPVDPDQLFTTLGTLMRLDHKAYRPTVLVVDDVEVNRAILCAALRTDYDILEAQNGKDALQVLEQHHGVDLLVTDLMMPDMDGAALIQSLREDVRYRSIPIIANTEYGDAKQEQRLLELGANDFIYKPTTPKVVRLRARNALNRL